ncbi:MAG TPA: PQQ-binding-like beta-propeller repeat protein [Chloroflexota bacterium]|nr:PQQ-binding-like beta-propeller repeat protein [Chloroflexota bacterium]
MRLGYLLTLLILATALIVIGCGKNTTPSSAPTTAHPSPNVVATSASPSVPSPTAAPPSSATPFAVSSPIAAISPSSLPVSGTIVSPTEVLTTTASASAATASTAPVWPVFDIVPARLGATTGGGLGPSNLGQLAVAWTQQLPAVADAPPVATANRLFFTLKDGRTIALDLQSGQPIWQAATTGPKITTASPALDPSGAWLYAYGLDGYVHKYATADGKESTGSGWPVQITSLPQVEKGSSALNLANGRLYVTTSGYLGDQGHYNGHLVTIDLATGSAVVFNSLCSNHRTLQGSDANQANFCASEQSGIWARAGAVVEPLNGTLFLATGNGPWNGSTDWGDSVLELSGDGRTLLDSYTPASQAELNRRDLDLGSAAPALLPEQHSSKTPYLAVQAGKDGLLRLLNRRNLSGKGQPGQLGGELQSVPTPGGCQVLTHPAVWTAPDHTTWLFVASRCGLAGLALSTDANGESKLVSRWEQHFGTTSPIVVDGVLYTARSGILAAMDPLTGRQLWLSPEDGEPGAIGPIHWESPIVAAGHLIIEDERGNVTAFAVPNSKR